MRAYQQALRLAPNSARVNKQIGYYYLAKGQNDTAKIYLQRSFQLNPRQPEVAGELGRLGVIIQPVTPKQQNLNKLEKEK
jgi:Flp pilus assembly protein TadD